MLPKGNVNTGMFVLFGPRRDYMRTNFQQLHFGLTIVLSETAEHKTHTHAHTQTPSVIQNTKTINNLYTTLSMKIHTQHKT